MTDRCSAKVTRGLRAAALVVMAWPGAAAAGSHPCAPAGTQCRTRIKDGHVSSGVTTSTITVSGDCPANAAVETVSVDVDIAHTHVGDLKLRVRSPDGREVVLLEGLSRDVQKGGCPGQDVRATFSLSGEPAACGEASPAVTGQVRPVAPLSALAGAQRNGTWSLLLEDVETDHVGALLGWQLNLSCGLPTVTLVAADAWAREGATDTAMFRVQRDGDASAPLDVLLAYSGTATPGTDYTALPTRVTIPAGALSAEVTLTALEDAEDESTETVAVALEAGVYNRGSPSVATLSIVGEATRTALAASANPVAEGTAVTFTATVSASGAVAGSVEFVVENISVARTLLAGGMATHTAVLPPGTHRVVARYPGDVNLAPSESAPLVMMVAVDTGITLTASATTVAAGEAVVFDASVTDPRGVPSGHVVFRDADGVLGTAPLSNGNASLVLTDLAVGMHAVTAQHVNGAGALSSTSQPVNVTVALGTSTTTLSAARTTVEALEGVQLLATVGAAHGQPAGVVHFREGTAVLGYGTLSQGAAVAVLTGLAAGTHTLVAEYMGSAMHAGSTSTEVTVTVNAAPAPPAGNDDDDDNNDSGCGCSASLERGVGFPGVALMLALLGLRTARRRR